MEQIYIQRELVTHESPPHTSPQGKKQLEDKLVITQHAAN